MKAVYLLLVCSTFLGAVKTQELDCLDGDLRMLPTAVTREGIVQLCRDNEWATVCRDNGNWDAYAGNLACAQLGYKNTGSTVGYKCSPLASPRSYIRAINCGANSASTATMLDECLQGNQAVTECHDGCSGNRRRHAKVKCLPADCSSSLVRLVDGSSIREGRVEVCQDGRWGTVHNSGWTVEQANRICSQLGFPDQGATIKTIPHTRFVQLKYNCSINSTNQLSCTLTNIPRNYSTDLAIECSTYSSVLPSVVSVLEQQFNSNISELQTQHDARVSSIENQCQANISQRQMQYNSTLVAITQDYNQCKANISNGQIQFAEAINQIRSECGNPAGFNTTGMLGGLVGVLVSLMVALVIGWAITCLACRKTMKQSTKTIIDSGRLPDNERELCNPVYDSNCIEPEQYSPTYETLDKNQARQLSTPRPARQLSMPSPEDEENNYHLVSNEEETGVYSVLEGAGNYEVPVNKQTNSRVWLCEEEYSTLKH